MAPRPSNKRPPESHQEGSSVTKRARGEDFSTQFQLAVQPTTQTPVAQLTEQNLMQHTVETASQTEAHSTPTPATANRSQTFNTTLGEILRRNGVVHHRLSIVEPEDYDDLESELDATRASGSATEYEFTQYVHEVETATNKASLLNNTLISMLLKKPSPYESFARVLNEEWTNVVPTRVTRNLSNPKPDYYESFNLESYNFAATTALKGHIQPSVSPIAMPRFAVEVTDPSTGTRQSDHLAAYNGAVMVEAVKAQHKYIDQPFEYMVTQALTISTTGHAVTIRAHHLRPSKNKATYHGCTMGTNLPTESQEEFSMTRRRVRNAQDWARKKMRLMMESLNDVHVDSDAGSDLGSACSAETPEFNSMRVHRPPKMPLKPEKEKLPTSSVNTRPWTQTDNTLHQMFPRLYKSEPRP